MTDLHRTPAPDHDAASAATLDDRLQRLADRLVATAPVDDDGGAMLVALLPCRSSAGEVAVACWESSDGARGYGLHALDTAERIGNDAAMREALQLVAMVEALEEATEPLRVRELIDGLIGWRESITGEQATGPAVEAVTAALWLAVETLQQLDRAASTDDDAVVRIADTALLDELGGLLMRLDGQWRALEGAAEMWSSTIGQEDEAAERLWRTLADGRRGPLAIPAAEVIEAGRFAGSALADEVLAQKSS